MQSYLKKGLYQSKWPEWNALALVSRRWRNVALASPSLWNHITFYYTRPWVEAMLERSKQAPLEVIIATRFSQQSEGLLDRIFANISRLRI
ncbi:hypothetical protein BKA70DRAFT_1252689, partial [Coprinopsis sp. MPI-PUGE-AT-0042]